MKRIRENEIWSSAAIALMGLLFMIYQSQVVSIAMSIIGCTFIVLGIFDVLRRMTVFGVIKIVVGALVLATGWLLIRLALYILGACMLVVGVTQLVAISKKRIRKINLSTAMFIAQPVLYILVGICLFFNQGGAISAVFIVAGIFLVIDGIAGIVGALTDRR